MAKEYNSKQLFKRHTVLCGVCSYEKRPAVSMNNIDVCHDCLKFIKSRSKLNGNNPFNQLKADTLYIACNITI